MWISFLLFMLTIYQSAVSATTEELVEAAARAKVTFPCQAGQDSNTVVWHHYPIGAKLAKIVYYVTVFEAYRSRFIVTGSRIGEFNLTILEVNLGDSARYTCTSGQQMIRSFELTVLELYPSPQSCASNSSNVSVIGRNSCGFQPDIVSLNCTLRYQGNFQPFLQWKSTFRNSLASTVKTIDNRTILSTLILKAEEHESATYTCFVKYMNSSLVSRFSWSLEINIITLFNKTQNYSSDCNTQSVPCSVDATTDCVYTWTNNKSEEIDQGSTLFLQHHQEGQYTCKADCVFRKEDKCSFEAVKVNNTCNQGKNAAISTGLIVGTVLGVSLVAIFVIIALIFWYRKKRKKKTAQQIRAITQEGDEETARVGELDIIEKYAARSEQSEATEIERLSPEIEQKPENFYCKNSSVSL